MKTSAVWVLALTLAGAGLQAQDSAVKPLLTKDLAETSGKELMMIAVDYQPGASSPAHTPSRAGARLRARGLDRDAGQGRAARHADAGANLV